MRDSIIHHFTRGGQVFFHRWHMTWQIIMRCVAVALIIWLALFGGWLWVKFDARYWQLTKAKYQADMLLVVNRAHATVQVPVGQQGRLVTMTANEFKHNAYVHRLWQAATRWFLQLIYDSVWCALIVMIGFLVYFWYRGQQQLKREHIDGDRLVSVKKIARLLRRQNRASHCVIDGLPLVKGAETQHMGVVGTTGTGKSVLIKKILRHVAACDERAVVYDKTGELTERFFDPARGDILLNPFDARMPNWSLWQDYQSAPAFDGLAASLMPHVGNDPFWVLGARTIFSAMAREYAKTTTTPTLPDFLTTLYQADISKLTWLKGTEAAQITNSAADKTLASLMATLTTYTKSLRYLDAKGTPFSIRDWVQSGKGWLFLPSHQTTHEAVKPLLSTWLDIAMDALLSLPPDPDRRLWYVLDELPSLNQLPALPTCLAQGRKFGACLLLGFQSIAQLAEQYQQTGSQKIAALLNTRFYFRQGDHAMADWASRNLGEATYLESREGVSYGANAIRDGVNVNRQEHKRALATPSDLLSLPDLQCYVRLAGDVPITKQTLTIETTPIKHPAWIEKSTMSAIPMPLGDLPTVTESSSIIDTLQGAAGLEHLV